MSLGVPQGFRLTGVACGIKQDTSKEDLTLIVADQPCVAAGVYTQNLIVAASVEADRSRTPSDQIRAVVINSGNANACTGDQGTCDAEEMCRLAAEACGAQSQQALVMSTGIIGEYLPMEKIRTGITKASEQLGSDLQAFTAAASGIMTTDQYPKMAARTLEIGDRVIQLSGIAKGAGMIGPKMATMLGVLMTDATLTPETAQAALATAVNDSFNCISVEGHTSTNDTVLLLASGAACDHPLTDDELEQFSGALRGVCIDLARQIPADGEGSSHLITIDVSGAATRDDAFRIAKTVAESALVKTAIAGADPNWGRIVSAAGYAGVAFNPKSLRLTLNGTPLYADGQPLPFDEAAVARSLRESCDTEISLELGEGDHSVRFWTSDLTVDYVKLNSDYHT